MTIRKPGKRQSLKPRKLPQQSRSEQTVATILEAAALILETKGLEAFNTNLVAERAGVSIGSLYQYFPGKDALIVALSLRERAVFIDDVRAALDESTGIKAFKRLITASVHQQLRRPVLARQLDFEENRPAIAKELAPSMLVISGLIRQIMTHPDIPRQANIDIAIEDVVAIVRAIVDAAGIRGEADNKALERRVCRAVFGYLGIVEVPSEKSKSRK